RIGGVDEYIKKIVSDISGQTIEELRIWGLQQPDSNTISILTSTFYYATELGEETAYDYVIYFEKDENSILGIKYKSFEKLPHLLSSFDTINICANYRADYIKHNNNF